MFDASLNISNSPNHSSAGLPERWLRGGFVLRGSKRLRLLADSFHHLHHYSVFHHQHACGS